MEIETERSEEGPALTPRRRLTQAEAREQTRRMLLAAAADVFARNGFAGASLEEIAEVAGYTTGALYYHFANKQQLFLELLRTRWTRQTATEIRVVSEIFASDSADPFASLSRFVVTRAARQAESESLPLSGEFWLYALRNPEAMDVVAEKLREQVDGLEPVIAGAMDRAGTAPGITSGEMTTVVLALFQGLTRRRRINHDSVPDDLYARVLQRLFAPGAPVGDAQAGVPED
ncbi:MAG: TetR/AcrR family transcriptional regulator [Trebonia sp.]